jgi:glutathione S-transferase
MMKLLRSQGEAQIPFAPPFLRDGEAIVSHVANILMYLGPKLGLAPHGENARIFANAMQSTITDVVAEVHDTHHPIANSLYYEDQKEPAKARASAFLSERMPKYLGYFERVLAQNPAGPAHSVGDAPTYVDLSLFQLVEGLRYAFPRASADIDAKYPLLTALAAGVRVRSRIAAYLKSPRRVAFNESGIFRHYRELDQDAS